MGSIRKLDTGEQALLLAHLLRLSDEDRRMRFCAPVGDASLALHCERSAARGSALVGWFQDGVLRAAGELALSQADDPEPREAELALSVETAWQRAGVGGRLLGHLLLMARNRGIEHLYMYCLADNVRMRALARRFSGSLEMRDGEVHARVLATAPGGASRMEEMLLHGCGRLASAFASARVSAGGTPVIMPARPRRRGRRPLAARPGPDGKRSPCSPS